MLNLKFNVVVLKDGIVISETTLLPSEVLSWSINGILSKREYNILKNEGYVRFDIAIEKHVYEYFINKEMLENY